jgi:hypothetical protein
MLYEYGDGDFDQCYEEVMAEVSVTGEEADPDDILDQEPGEIAPVELIELPRTS